ncbi:hypothetical protein ACTG9Q_31710 [Actinokineospora sp. 24-640]
MFTSKAFLLSSGLEALSAHHGIRVLHRLNLLTHDDVDDTIRIHGLVQRVVRELFHPESLATSSRVAATSLVDIWPPIDTLTEIGAVLRANTSALELASSSALFNPTVHPVLFRTGQSLREQGLAADAAEHFSTLYQRAVAVHGPDHPWALSARAAYAHSKGDAGDTEEAASEYEYLLAHRLRTLGPDDPLTMTTRNNLAH